MSNLVEFPLPVTLKNDCFLLKTCIAKPFEGDGCVNIIFDLDAWQYLSDAAKKAAFYFAIVEGYAEYTNFNRRLVCDTEASKIVGLEEYIEGMTDIYNYLSFLMPYDSERLSTELMTRIASLHQE